MRQFSILTLAGTVAVMAACGDGNDGNVVTKTDSGTLPSPSTEAAEERGASLVRVVNAVPGSGPLTVHADDETPFTGVEYKMVTPYREVRGNMVRFRILPGGSAASTGTANRARRATGGAADSGMGQMTDTRVAGSVTDVNALATNNEVMTDGNRYTIFIMPDESGAGDGTAQTGAKSGGTSGDAAGTAAGANRTRRLMMKVVRDELGGDSSVAQVRFINAAQNAGELDLTLQGQSDPIFDDVDYGSEAEFKAVDPSTRSQLTIRREDERAPLTTVRGIRSLQPGHLYTVVVAGRQGSWDVITFHDMVRDLMPTDTARGTTRGR